MRERDMDVNPEMGSHVCKGTKRLTWSLEKVLPPGDLMVCEEIDIGSNQHCGAQYLHSHIVNRNG